MKSVETKKYVHFLNDASQVFLNVYLNTNFDSKKLSAIKRKYCEEDFEYRFENFKEELIENIDEYQDINIIFDYLVVSLKDLTEDDYYREITCRDIISLENEVSFLLKLRDLLINAIDYLRSLLELDKDGTPDFELFELYYKRIEELDRTVGTRDRDFLSRKFFEQIKQPKLDSRFEFENLMAECATLSDDLEKFKLIEDRLYDFCLWQVQHDYIDPATNNYAHTLEYYPKFEDMCKIELQRYVSRIKHARHNNAESEDLNAVNMTGEQVPVLKWAESQAAFLELFVSLYKADVIKNADGTNLSRKEFLAYFQKIFSLDIKDLEGNLARATNRKINVTPFLDKLKTAFENYSADKLDKKSKR